MKTKKCIVNEQKIESTKKEVDVIDREYYIKKLIEKEKENKNNIVVEIYGGCLSAVHNLPKDFEYTLIDWDCLKENMDDDEFQEIVQHIIDEEGETNADS